MGLMKLILRTRLLDLLLSLFCLLFICSIVFVNVYLTSHISSTRQLSNYDVKNVDEALNEEEILPYVARSGRVRRAVDTETTTENSLFNSNWSVPADTYPVVLNLPWGGCTSPTILEDEFPNATCFGHCTAATCDSNTVTNILNGDAELVCTAKIIQLGFKRTGTYAITRLLQRHPDFQVNFGSLFSDANGVVLDTCPVPLLRDTSTSYHFNAYSMDSLGTSQSTYYLHCEDCLTLSVTDQYFGTFFLDIPTALLQYLSTPGQRFIITLKNPTDRAIAEYFYPFIKAGTDLNTVGGEVLHDAMAAAILEARECMSSLGPTPCIYGLSSWTAGRTTLSETTMLYESCYATHITQVIRQIDVSQVYFLMIEEYQANPEQTIRDMYSFIGVDYLGTISIPDGVHIHKPILAKTIRMLDAFFTPFNSQLSTLLGNTKWQYSRS